MPHMRPKHYERAAKAMDAEQSGAKPKNFIAGAIKKPGSLRAELGAKPGKDIPKAKLAKAAKVPGKLGQRARLAETLEHMNKG